MDLSSIIKERALAAGFDLAGIVSLDAMPQSFWDDLDFARRWVDSGYGGEMHYLANPKRDDPRRALPSAKSVICVGLVYNAPLPYSTEVTESSQQSAVGSRQNSRQEAVGSRQKTEGSGQKAEGSSELEIRSQRLANRNLPTVPPSASCLLPTAYCLLPTAFRSHAWISRYAWGHDYHRVMRAKLDLLRAEMESLAPGVETRVYVDTGPVVERALARYSGIGWVGKNTCLINQEKGSWFFLGVILTNLALAADFPAPDRCGSCTRCLEACPTGALIEPYVMDASRCISYFTIELKGSIPLGFRSAIGRNIFGCDICQDVCPWNSSQSSEGVKNPGSAGVSPALLPRYQSISNKSGRDARAPRDSFNQLRQVGITDMMEFQPMQVTLPEETDTLQSKEPSGNPASAGRRDSGFGVRDSRTADPGSRFSSANPEPPNPKPVFSLFNPPLEALASLSEEDFRRVFSSSPIKRAKFRGWLRNLCVAMGNSGSAQFIPWLERARQHPDPIVREHAEWALERVKGEG